MAANSLSESLYVGHVSHKRLRPVQHSLCYNVFSIFLDCETIAETAKRLKLFSYNRWNVLSLHDRDHGDGTDLKGYLANVAANAGVGTEVVRFFMLCYPRVFGYAFNPITVYYGLDQHDHIRLMVYEVNNTFGARQTYVLPVALTQTDLINQSCRKQMYVSPFNTESGAYRFAVTQPEQTLTVGVALTTDLGPTLKAHFAGERQELTDRNLMKAIAGTGWMTVKVIAGIHYEALKLWLKGLPIKSRVPKTHDAAGHQAAPKESVF